MKKEDLLLIDAWRHGEISDEDFKLLESRLEKDTELRASFRALSDLEEGLSSIESQIGDAVCFPDQTRKESSISWFAIAAVLIVSIGLSYAFLRDDIHEGGMDASAGNYLDFDVPLVMVGEVVSGEIASSTMSLNGGGAEIRSGSGASVQIVGPVMFGLNSPSGGVLYYGAVRARTDDEDATYAIEAGNLRFLDRGTEFSIRSKGEDELELEVLDGEVEVQTLNRMPKFFWNFDGPLRDCANSVKLTLGARASKVKGLVGSGALSFDNQPESFARVVGQTGKMVGTGEMSFSTGISIEALFVSKWSGKFLDYDEIFRKEDGKHRILLSFQNDKDVGDYDTPEVSQGPVLSFGLHLDGFGYEELDMPLDGKEGRPALKELVDGQVHHVVASYDSFTGKKSIFLDGKLVFGHGYPLGTLVLSGGPSEARIGNHQKVEPFNGVIDELALYPFALSAGEISLHANRAMDGLSYFEAQANRPAAYAQWIPIKSYPMGWKLDFNKLTGELISSEFLR